MHKTLLAVSVVALISACGPEEIPFLQQDSDSDGLLNEADWCPTVAEVPNGFEDEDGCPDEAPAPPPEPLSFHISGVWQGTLTIQRPNRDPLGRPGLVVSVANVRDHDAMVVLSCYWSSRSVRTYGVGSGRAMSVMEPTPCPLDGPSTCQSRMEYGTGTLTVDTERRMTLQLNGVYEDCMGRSPATFTMIDVAPLN